MQHRKMTAIVKGISLEIEHQELHQFQVYCLS